MNKVHSNIENVRFIDVNDYQTILINGWGFIENEFHYNYILKINNEFTPFQLKKVKRIDVKNTFKNSSEYCGFFMIIKSESRKIDSLELYIGNKILSECILNLNGKELDDLKDNSLFKYHIDHFFFDEDNNCADVYGYALSRTNQKIDIDIFEDENNSVDFIRHSIRRADLVKNFVVDEKDVECGFNLMFDYNPEATYFIQFKCDGKVCLEKLEIEPNVNLKTKSEKTNNFFEKKFLSKYLKKSDSEQDNEIDYNEWRQHFVCKPEELEKQRNTRFEYEPKISLVVATFNTPIPYLKEMIDSVINQTYSNWELCIADGSTSNEVLDYIQKEYQDERILSIRLNQNYGIAGNMNEAIKISTGDYIALYDHDDTIEPQTLFEYVKVLNEKPNVEVIYSDEDKVNGDGSTYFQPHFKPDFNLDLLQNCNYITHFLIVNKKVFDHIGLLDGEFDGAQDYDFILRCAEYVGSENIYHIPYILYHWRMHQSSTAGNPESKMYAYEAGVRALQAHYDRMGIHAKVEKGQFLGIYRTHYILDSHPKVSIIIPNIDHIDDLSRCIDSIINKSTYNNYEIIVVENNSTEQSIFDYYKQIEEKYDFVKVVYLKNKFNNSAIYNFASQYANGEYLLFLSRATKVISENFIEEMLGYCMRKDVGAVGARLYYEDDRIQQAGIVYGQNGTILHCFRGCFNYDLIYQNRLFCSQDYSALTDICMMVSYEVFEEVHGFDENMKFAFHDIEFCLKLREKGYLNVYTPYAELYVCEEQILKGEAKRNQKKLLKDEKYFKKKWITLFKDGDPSYNQNLSLKFNDFRLKALSDF